MSWETVAAALGAMLIMGEVLVRLAKRTGEFATKSEVDVLALRVQHIEESLLKLEEQLWASLKRIEARQESIRKEQKQDLADIKRNWSRFKDDRDG